MNINRTIESVLLKLTEKQLLSEDIIERTLNDEEKDLENKVFIIVNELKNLIAIEQSAVKFKNLVSPNANDLKLGENG